jgi:type II secretory pathway pseudopilin PulG
MQVLQLARFLLFYRCTRIAASQHTVMGCTPPRGRDRGFTLLEALVILAILGIALTVGLPSLTHLISRSKLEAEARETATLLQRARLEAIKRRVQTVVLADADAGTMTAFADVDGPAVGDPPDLELNPLAGELARDTDYTIRTIGLSARVQMAGPGAQPAIEGFTLDPSGNRVAVFLPTGAADSVGSLRFADAAGANFLEVRLEPAGTGRVEIRKWNRDRSEWLARREGGIPWTWYDAP